MTATNTSAPGSPADRPRRARILVADDSPEMRSLLSDILSDEGYEVTVAASGARALSIMNDDPPELLITDLLMPGMSGFALRTLMLRRPDLAAVRVVVLSAYWHRPSETLDVAAVLEKPLNIDRLLETVRRLTDGTAVEEDPPIPN